MLRSRATWGHGSFVLGEHFNADGTIDTQKYNNTVVVDDRISDPTFRDVSDPYHLSTGSALGSVHKGRTFYRLRGRILVPDATQAASLSDRERALRAAFDPSLCLTDSPATDGAYTLDWDELTTDTVNYPSGRLPQRIYARPAHQPQIIEALRDGTVRQFTLGLIAPDPRIYAQAETTLVLTPGSATGNVINLGTVPAPLKATIVMAGAGSATFTITRGGVAFILTLVTMVNLDSVVVVFETCGAYGRGRRITKNAVDAFSLKTSAVSTWLNAPVGTTSFVMTNTANVTSCTLAWRSAWA